VPPCFCEHRWNSSGADPRNRDLESVGDLDWINREDPRLEAIHPVHHSTTKKQANQLLKEIIFLSIERYLGFLDIFSFLDWKELEVNIGPFSWTSDSFSGRLSGGGVFQLLECFRHLEEKKK
jgi:hypothetical protein